MATLSGGAAVAALDERLAGLGYTRTPSVADGPMGAEVICPALTLKKAAELRPRAILHYESRRAARLLPPCPVFAVVSGLPPTLRAYLDPVKVASQVAAVGGRYQARTGALGPPDAPRVHGYLSFGGAQDRPRPGSLVEWAQPGLWRVLAIEEETLTLLSRDRDRPKRARITAAQVTKHRRQRRPAYSIDGLVYAIKAWGEPPEGPGGVLIWDERLTPARARPLTDAECWRIQGHAEEDYQVMRTLTPTGVYDRYRIAGNSMHAAVIGAVAGRTIARLRLLDATLAAGRLQRWWRGKRSRPPTTTAWNPTEASRALADEGITLAGG